MKTENGKDRKQVAKQEAKKNEGYYEDIKNNKNAHHEAGADHDNDIAHSATIMMLFKFMTMTTATMMTTTGIKLLMVGDIKWWLYDDYMLMMCVLRQSHDVD